jgi:alcohol dehydrogenase class IV
MMFEFATAGRIVFGRGTLQKAAEAAGSLGNRLFIVTGKTDERAGPLPDRLTTKTVKTVNVRGEPTVASVLAAVAAAREFKAEVVIGIGGGSVLDTGKVVAALMTNEGELMDYLEVIGGARPPVRPPVPYIAVPTTAGTGAEVTRNAVIDSPGHGVKVSMRSPLMLPRLAVVDPDLTRDLPPDVTAATGMDALTQLLEAFVSANANPLTDGICREGLKRAARWLRRACERGEDMRARENMSLASLFGGLALANAKLGAVHGFAAPVGASLSIPHGVVCGRLLAPVMAANIRALRDRAPEGEGLDRYAETARILTGDPHAGPEAGVEWVAALCGDLDLPDLASYGLADAPLPDLAARAARASSMKGNPVALTNTELREILAAAV